MPNVELFPEDAVICAYSAGIMDGEGCIRLQPKTYGLDVSVGNTDMELLIWLKTHWGGKIYPNRHHSLNSRNKPFFHWRLTGKNGGFRFLRQILPYLVIKADRAAKALELERLHGLQNNYMPGFNEKAQRARKKIYEELKVMNHRGSAEVQ